MKEKGCIVGFKMCSEIVKIQPYFYVLICCFVLAKVGISLKEIQYWISELILWTSAALKQMCIPASVLTVCLLRPFLSLEDSADFGEISELQPHTGVNRYAKTKLLEISSSGC